MTEQERETVKHDFLNKVQIVKSSLSYLRRLLLKLEDIQAGPIRACDRALETLKEIEKTPLFPSNSTASQLPLHTDGRVLENEISQD